MSSHCDASHLDLVQTTPSGKRVRQAVGGLALYFSFEATFTGRGWSKVEASSEGSKALSRVREAFMAEFEQSKELINIANAISAQPEETFTLSRTVRLLVFQGGESEFDTLVDKKDCIVLITVAISGSPVATVQEPKGPHGEQRTTTLTFKADSVHMIAGRCSILVPDKTRIICVMLCIWKGSI